MSWWTNFRDDYLKPVASGILAANPLTAPLGGLLAKVPAKKKNQVIAVADTVEKGLRAISPTAAQTADKIADAVGLSQHMKGIAQAEVDAQRTPSTGTPRLPAPRGHNLGQAESAKRRNRGTRNRGRGR